MRNTLCGFLKLRGNRQGLVQGQTLACCFVKIKKNPVFHVKWNTGSFWVKEYSLKIIFYFKTFRRIQVMIPTTQNGKYAG